jgi:AGZA family xanthine/uracil permease-like MFS transporter
MLAKISTFFEFEKNNTHLRQEAMAGLTTFLTMSYIIFVNPAILASTGMDKAAVFSATCLVTIFGTIISAFIANNPIAIAPGMALNTFFAYIVVGSKGFSWQSALGMVFISGVLFVFMTLTQFRQKIIEAIPNNLKIAILLGVSLFIALIALKNNGIIVGNSETLVNLGDLSSHSNLFFFLGLFLMLLFDLYQIKGGILISIFCVSALSYLFGFHQFSGVVSTPPSIASTFLSLRFDELFNLKAISQILAFLLIALFDATGTFIGLINQGVFSNQNHEQIKKRISKGLLADSLTTTLASLIGTSTTGPFLESAAGITAGGRTGFCALIIALLFALSLFFFPLVQSIPYYAINPALFYIALCMLKGVTNLKTEPLAEFAPAAITMVMIPLSFSVATGIGLGILLYCFLKLCKQEHKDLSLMIYFLALLFLTYFYLT